MEDVQRGIDRMFKSDWLKPDLNTVLIVVLHVGPWVMSALALLR